MSENSHDSGSTPATGPTHAPDPRAWVAPLISTVVTLPMGLVALFIGGLTPMACDSCNGAAADRFDASFTTAWTVLWIGLILALIVLVAAWAVPHQLRYAARRVGLALTAPTVVGVTFVAFMALVDWP
ncbi:MULTISPECIES: hypothetical protein [unclassified Streptomyces]|uniref:hypothetical protein n=1 Tax=unclassified Streptomyces TaxID=2593676 RepID=UPI001B362A14|nr:MULTISPECIES: hypothetical protein [unclassified Streptomyces]MBQ1108534.1 hypothetical protein [Streptomyces sp. 404i]MBQ1117576.1 hypothetical protein [Streptomyces sp. C3-3]